MKKQFLITLMSLTIAFGLSAATETKYKGTNDSVTTRICLTAANKGYDAANKLFKAEKMIRVSSIKSIQCNGMSVAEFANAYYQKESKTRLALKSSQK